MRIIEHGSISIIVNKINRFYSYDERETDRETYENRYLRSVINICFGEDDWLKLEFKSKDESDCFLFQLKEMINSL